MEEERNKYIIPASIIVAGVLVAFAIIYTRGAPSPGGAGSISGKTQDASQDMGSASVKNLKPVTSEDHILGNPNAPIKIVEFSDLECPFCKSFHTTLEQAMSTYGKDGKVAWVYRHFPLASLHPKAPNEAQASECAWEQGGNDKFWEFINNVFAITPSNNGLDPAKLPEIASKIGLDRAKFESCLASGKYAKKVEAQYQEAVSAGGQGTPYSIVVTKSGQTYPINGALPYDQVKGVLDQALGTLN